MVQFQGMIAEYERAQILERTRRGKTHRAKAGTINVLSGAPFGYRYVAKPSTPTPSTRSCRTRRRSWPNCSLVTPTVVSRSPS